MVEAYRVVVHCAGSPPLPNLNQVTVEIKGEWVRWRLCEMEPPPDFIKQVSVVRWWQWGHTCSQQWYFICESCQVHRGNTPSTDSEGSPQLSASEGSPSTASEDESEDAWQPAVARRNDDGPRGPTDAPTQ